MASLPANSRSGSATIKPQPHATIGCQELLQNDCTYSGWLRKQMVFSRRLARTFGRRNSILTRFCPWNRRYVVLCEGCLYHYKSETDRSPAGSVNLAVFPKIATAGEISHEQQPWAFKLSCDPKLGHATRYFSAGSEREMKKWMEEIQKQVALAIGQLRSDYRPATDIILQNRVSDDSLQEEEDLDPDDDYDEIMEDDKVKRLVDSHQEHDASTRPLPQLPNATVPTRGRPPQIRRDSSEEAVSPTLAPPRRAMPPVPGDAQPTSTLPLAPGQPIHADSPARLRPPAKMPIPAERHATPVSDDYTFPEDEPYYLTETPRQNPNVKSHLATRPVPDLPVDCPEDDPYDLTDAPPENPNVKSHLATRPVPDLPASASGIRVRTPFAGAPMHALRRTAPRQFPSPTQIGMTPPTMAAPQRFPTPAREKPPTLPKPNRHGSDSPGSSGDGSFASSTMPDAVTASTRAQQRNQSTEDLTWPKIFWNGVDRDACNQVLLKINVDGAFLVRQSEGQHMTLVVLVQKIPRKFRVVQQDQRYHIKEGWSFGNIIELIAHYRKNNLPCYDTKLTIPYTAEV